MSASLNQLALLFMKYFEHTEQGGWEQMMLHDAREKSYARLPTHGTNPWQQLKEKSRVAFKKYHLPTGSLAIQ